MKKIILTLLVVFALFQSVCFANQSDNETEDLSNLLTSLGCTRASLQGEITREDFVLYMADLTGTIIPTTSGKSPYHDISTANSAYKEIRYFYDCGLFENLSGNFYRPKAKITMSDATEFIVRFMGYKGELLKNKSVKTIAFEMGMYDDIEYNPDGTLEYSILNKIIYNLLDEPVVINEPGVKVSYIIQKDRTLLSERLNAKKVKGIVTDDGKTALNGETDCVQDNFEINHYKYLKNNIDVTPFLGRNVEAYIRTDNFSDDESLLFIKEYKNDVVELKASELENSETTISKIAYLKSDRVKFMDLVNGFDFIYNGEAKSVNSVDDLRINNGSITLIDNNTDGEYDVVIIKEYTNFWISAIDKDNYMLYSEYKNLSMSMHPDDIEYKIFKAGSEISFSDLQQYDTLLIYKSVDEEYMEIYVSSESFEGRISSVDSNNYKKAVMIEGKSYVVSDECNQEPIAGYNGEYWLNSEGEIVTIALRWGEGKMYGYVFSAYLTDSCDEGVLKMYTTNGFIEDIKFNKSVKIDGIKYNSQQAMVEYMKNYKDQFVRYESNKKGFVTLIDTLAYGASDEDDTFSRTLNKTTVAHRWNGIFSGSFAVNSDTIVMVLPDDVNKREKFSISSASAFAIDTNYTVSTFDVSDAGLVQFLVVHGRASDQKSFALIKKIRIVLDEEDEVVYEVGLHNGKRLYADLEEHKEIADLKKGDLISYTLSDEEIEKFDVIIQANNFHQAPNVKNNSYGELCFNAVGIVEAEEKGIYKLKFDDGSTLVTNLNNVPVYLSEDKEIKTMTCDNIRVGDKLFILNSNVGRANMAVIYR